MALFSSSNDSEEDYSNLIYLDNNATTKEDKSVIELMIKHLKCQYSFGNPSSSHLFGTKAKFLIDQSREHVKNSINASNSSEILFTSGGTESNNLAIRGIIKNNINIPQHIITTPFEHPSVINTLKYLEKLNEKIEISFVNIDSNGIIDLKHFQQLIKPQTKLVTIMHSNNEIGLFYSLLFFILSKNFFLLKVQFNQWKK
jgi:cysteine desulfurase